MQARVKKIPPAVAAAAYSVEGFCEAFGFSRPHFYNLRRDGKGPAIFKAGKRTLVSREAAEAWVRRLEGEAAAGASR